MRKISNAFRGIHLSQDLQRVVLILDKELDMEFSELHRQNQRLESENLKAASRRMDQGTSGVDGIVDSTQITKLSIQNFRSIKTLNINILLGDTG